MGIFRSYFKKSNNIISGVYANSSKNPVMEVSAYGLDTKKPSRYIFDINLDGLIEKVNNGIITENNCNHYLNMTNTIRYSPDTIGIKSYSKSIVRASSFSLEIFNIEEDWDEGSGYDFLFDPINPVKQVSNWYERRSDANWSTAGVNSNQLVGQQHFDCGNENLRINITNYINQRLFGTGYTNTLVYSGNTFGLGIKHTDAFENTDYDLRQSVAFHSKNTNTFYVPYVETEIVDQITDDRNFFYLDKTNELYLYLTNVTQNDTISINSVEIVDHNGLTQSTIASITKVRNDLYKISLNISSSQYLDCVIFTDKWSFSINGVDEIYTSEFYIQPNSSPYVKTRNNEINIKNYCFSLYGINENERIVAGNQKKIKIAIHNIYGSTTLNKPLDIIYRIYTKINNKFEINIINSSQFNRTAFWYEMDLDTSWLISQDYFLEVSIVDNNNQIIKNTISFTVVDDILLDEITYSNTPYTTTTTTLPMTTTTTTTI